MSNVLNTDLENAYKQFQLVDLPIFQNFQRISIRKLFKILTITELKDLPTVEAMNFYLYCHFFKNRLLYSKIFQHNLAYVNLERLELKQRIKAVIGHYEKMSQEIKSESDHTWADNIISALNDGLIALDTVQNRCDYYDNKVIAILTQPQVAINNLALKKIEHECAEEFLSLSSLFSEIGRIIGRE